MGEYAIDSPVSLITGKRESANSPNSALAATRNKRVVIMQEPGSNDQIQADVMKALTGGDRISTRDLNSTQIEFKPHAKYFMACNKIPSISDIDGGVIRRLKITEFVSRFVEKITDDDGEDKYMYEFKIDRELKNKLEGYKTVFMCILIDYYRIYRQEGLIAPDSVLKVTKRYENNNNNIKAFIDENIVRGKKSDYLTKDELKNIYKTDRLLQNAFSKFSNFINQLENALCTEFKVDNKKKIQKLEGYHLRRPDDEDEENDDDDDDL